MPSLIPGCLSALFAHNVSMSTGTCPRVTCLFVLYIGGGWGAIDPDLRSFALRAVDDDLQGKCLLRRKRKDHRRRAGSSALGEAKTVAPCKLQVLNRLSQKDKYPQYPAVSKCVHATGPGDTWSVEASVEFSKRGCMQLWAACIRAGRVAGRGAAHAVSECDSGRVCVA